MHLVHVEYQIQLAHILKALVQRFDKHLDEIQDAQLALGRVHAEHEVERRIVSVD